MNLDFLDKFDCKKYLGIYCDANGSKYIVEEISVKYQIILFVISNQQDRNSPYKVNCYKNQFKVDGNKICDKDYKCTITFYKKEKIDLLNGFSDNLCKCCNNVLKDSFRCVKCDELVHESCCDMSYEICNICMGNINEN